ncbi:hypothetical protein LINGRAHAP2_LOCUS19005 [Linum grandiflorum]
MRWKGR